MATITINGKKYNEKDLNKEALAQAKSIRLCDVELANVDNQIAMNKTARNAYSVTLADNLPEKKAASNRKNGVVIVNNEKYLIEDFNKDVQLIVYTVNHIDQTLDNLLVQQSIIKTAKRTYSRALAELVNN